MYSAKTSPKRYPSPKMQTLLQQMTETARTQELEKIKKVQLQQKMNHSFSLNSSRQKQFQQRSFFNNKTKLGQLLEADIKPNPYVFIPAYKNDTFIMPDRVFQKGKAGKRFVIKMKDTSIFSFKQKQDELTNQVLNKNEKQKTIVSRKIQQFNKMLDENDGKKKAVFNKWFLKTRKLFNPTHEISVFSQYEPLLQPKDPQTRQVRKISLSKTYDYRNKWRPATRGHETFTASFSKSAYSDSYHTSSER